MDIQKLDHGTRTELHGSRWERFVAPSLRVWAVLADRGAITASDWIQATHDFNWARQATDHRTRTLIALLSIIVLALIGLLTIVGTSVRVLGRMVTVDPTEAPRLVEILIVAVTALGVGLVLRHVVELRRRVQWQAQILRQIADNIDLLDSPDEPRNG